MLAFDFTYCRFTLMQYLKKASSIAAVFKRVFTKILDRPCLLEDLVCIPTEQNHTCIYYKDLPSHLLFSARKCRKPLHFRCSCGLQKIVRVDNFHRWLLNLNSL